MVSGVWSLWGDYKFWGKSLQEIFIKRFHFILITFHKSIRSNSFIFEYSRWWWDDQTLWGEVRWGGISKINLPPPGLQQFYSCEPQHLGSSTALRWYHRTQHHLDYDITLSTGSTGSTGWVEFYVLTLLILICHWLIPPRAWRSGIDMRSFKHVLQLTREWPLLWVSMTRIKRKVQYIFLSLCSSPCIDVEHFDDKARLAQKLYSR